VFAISVSDALTAFSISVSDALTAFAISVIDALTAFAINDKGLHSIMCRPFFVFIHPYD